jgi:phosphoribosylformylglycinamidine cyclo-ligase
MLDGAAIREGDAVIALRCRGLRSNGFSLARRVLAARLGPDWHAIRFDHRTWGESLLSPSRIYNPLVTSLRRAGPGLRGVAHITGGGIPDKLGRTLRASGLGADLDGLLPPHDFVLALQEMGDIPEDQAYRHWNMGSGMLLILDPLTADQTLARIRAAGHEGTLAGRIVREPVIRIQGRGFKGGIVEKNLAPTHGEAR